MAETNEIAIGREQINPGDGIPTRGIEATQIQVVQGARKLLSGIGQEDTTRKSKRRLRGFLDKVNTLQPEEAELVIY